MILLTIILTLIQQLLQIFFVLILQKYFKQNYQWVSIEINLFIIISLFNIVDVEKLFILNRWVDMMYGFDPYCLILLLLLYKKRGTSGVLFKSICPCLFLSALVESLIFFCILPYFPSLFCHVLILLELCSFFHIL